ncbi:MAG: hypothetical protein ACYCU0_09885 [Solirubrobacteraceae bacterium]
MNATEDSRRPGAALRRQQGRSPGGLAMRIGTALVLAWVVLCGSVPAAFASSSNARATHAYLVDQYRLASELLHQGAAARRAEGAAAARIARECPGAVSGMPQEPSLKSYPLTPRARGEAARLSEQKQAIEEELTTAVIQPSKSLYRPDEEAYAAEVGRLSWSNPAIAAAVQAAITARLEAISAPAPPFCTDASAWAQSGYQALPATSREFEKASRAARRSSDQGAEHLRKLLKPYENASDRALIHKTNASAKKLLVGALAALRTVRRLDGIVGLPQAAKEPKQTTLGRGHTTAGTRFEVSETGSGPLSAAGSCRRSATVAYSRPGTPGALIVGGPNNPICLSSPQYRHPALFCEVGIETIQTAVPPSVRSARLMLADGRTIESRVVGVSGGDGDTAGIYAQELRGSTSHAASLVELNAGRGVVLALNLPRYRCIKPRKKPEDLLRSTKLASGRTPEGEPFTISTFGRINGEPFVSVDIGVNPELNEPTIEPGASKAFPWSLSLGCAPHPYAILYGILAPPGKSVTAQTPEGAVALNVVPIKPRVHAKGPLVYGVFSAMPTELTVLGANGSTVYTENLQAEPTEATQFYEGYAEP